MELLKNLSRSLNLFMHSNSVFDFENVTGSEIFSITKADFLPYEKQELS